MKSVAKATQAEDSAETSAQLIRDSIREAIVERRLSPGTKLSENDVGNLFNVSRTLARAALQALSYEGLVSVEKNRGAFVAYPSPDEARQIFAARRLVEPGILREAAARMTPGDISQLKQLLLEEGRLMSERGQTARRAEIKASGDFHLRLAEISGNAIMQRFMEELVARSSLVIALYGQSTVSSCGHSEHGDIIAAIENDELDRACRLMLHHIAHIEADLDLRERKSLGLKEAFEL
ncbi:DNA-binding GntR family transcriptional regulator [Rhizobium leguminosarum]|uniref:DNA-binding GntR family transcriptional regulator n=1 Tax=Rhizobium leguminosarum TaxID=384 RepID=A0AAE2MLV5_RHILE|nr:MULTISPECIES: GntR family transcriptional regulator [Rhizobium]MBB4291289.1 DNA-binding GntR family transcriptional regulator [Rhizobium leguminosarum]MBB4297616.1 DNA-binding GntR family transcriptional regulator [Rhizobium leguminosarum]MBB4308756.1 DNA-binding GntR family transcriptional regulator [Rhizobium leguminosarum]MBB4416591.1 DNA-binding GntR family transcriptional regulator [Rhizobium leguminosarum]MBB4430441.1 DNA-binding GntR family transcriptional regulator [Rhizobium espera